MNHELKPVKFGLNHESMAPLNTDYGRTSNEGPSESREAHFRSDVDLSPRSLHHTLGPRRNQASPGDHIHDGYTSRKIGPLEMDPSNPGDTRAEWTIPVAATVADVVSLLEKFVNFRQV